MRASSASPMPNRETQAYEREVKKTFKCQKSDREDKTHVFNLKLKLQGVDLCDARVPLLIDKVHLCLQNPPLALSITETV